MAAVAWPCQERWCLPISTSRLSDSEGKVTGLDIDVAFAVLAGLGIETIETRLAADFISGVAAGNWTINVPMFVTPERAAKVAFSRPVWSLADGLMVRAGDSGWLASYEAVARDETAVLGVVAGQVQHQTALQAGVPGGRMRVFSTPDAAIDALLDGRIDGYATAAIVHRGLLARLRDDRLALVDFGTGGTPPALGAFSFALSSVTLREAFDRKLAEFIGSPEHIGIMKRYGFSDVEIAGIVPR
jgi:polar amino acid transport system substrate-binding protein